MTSFKKPSFELIKFNANDVIATSNPGGGCPTDTCLCNIGYCSNDCQSGVCKNQTA